MQPAAARDPAFDCCCNDHCNGIVGSDHCNASTATYLDTAHIPNGHGDLSHIYLYSNRDDSDFDDTADKDTADEHADSRSGDGNNRAALP